MKAVLFADLHQVVKPQGAELLRYLGVGCDLHPGAFDLPLTADRAAPIL